MEFGWQDVAAVLTVAAAAGYLLRRVFRRRSESAGCGGCHGCAAESAKPPLVSIEPLRRKHSRNENVG